MKYEQTCLNKLVGGGLGWGALMTSAFCIFSYLISYWSLPDVLCSSRTDLLAFCQTLSCLRVFALAASALLLLPHPAPFAQRGPLIHRCTCSTCSTCSSDRDGLEKDYSRHHSIVLLFAFIFLEHYLTHFFPHTEAYAFFFFYHASSTRRWK